MEKKSKHKIKINPKELAKHGDMTEEEIRERKWRIPRFWDVRGKKILFNNYIISKDGIVIRITKNSGTCLGKRIGIRLEGNGYLVLGLYSEGNRHPGTKFHRLMYETWKNKIPKGLQINHKDGVKSNNDLENLEVVTAKENIQHAIRMGLHSTERQRKAVSEVMTGEKHYGAKLTRKSVKEIRYLSYIRNWTQQKIADKFKVSKGCVNSILQGYHWNIEKLTKEELREKYGN